MTGQYGMPKNLAPWIGIILTCRSCGHSRIIDGSWLSSVEVRRALDKSARTARRVPRCGQCGARGWGNVSTESAPPDGWDDYDPREGTECEFWREDDVAWEEHMEWLMAYERETEGPEAYGRGPLRFPE